MSKKWELLDDDCMQYGKSDGYMYKFVQYVWLDTTEEEEQPEYLVVADEIDSRDICQSEKNNLLSFYGIDEEVKDVPPFYFAEMYFETYCIKGCNIIAEFHTEEEAKSFILDYIKNN